MKKILFYLIMFVSLLFFLFLIKINDSEICTIKNININDDIYNLTISYKSNKRPIFIKDNKCNVFFVNKNDVHKNYFILYANKGKISTNTNMNVYFEKEPLFMYLIENLFLKK